MRFGSALATAAGFAAALAVAAAALAKGAALETDLSLTAKFSGTTTLGPDVRITVRNRGTATQDDAVVSVFADTTDGTPLYTTTVDLAPGAKATLSARVYPSTEAMLLVATVAPAVGADEAPSNNVVRTALWMKGAKGVPVAGRAIHLLHCASCHGTDADGGTGPDIRGTSSKGLGTLFAAAAVPHDAPTLSKADAKALSKFLKDPNAVTPPTPPEPVEVWPTYTDDVGPLLMGHCKGCHAGPGADAGVRIDTYEGASKSAGKSLSSVKSGSMPQVGRRLTAEEIELLENWIVGGKRP
jgi:mono/diheme cytochrome c family protein